MRRFVAASFVTASLLLAGCSKPSIVGKWNMSGGQMPAGTVATIEFKENTFTSDVKLSAPGMVLKMAGTGTYTYDGKTLKQTTTGITIDDSGLPAAQKKQLAQVKPMIDAEVKKTIEGEAKLEGDTLTVSAKEGVVTYTRIK
jgi:hypothetical protein